MARFDPTAVKQAIEKNVRGARAIALAVHDRVTNGGPDSMVLDCPTIAHETRLIAGPIFAGRRRSQMKVQSISSIVQIIHEPCSSDHDITSRQVVSEGDPSPRVAVTDPSMVAKLEVRISM